MDFIVHGKSVNCIFSQYILRQIYFLPNGSIILYNKTAYIDDSAWINTVKEMDPGIRTILVIRHHLYRWICLTFDGFESYVNVNDSHQVFHGNKIRAVKE